MTDLILTEKHSVAADFAKALGIQKKRDGYFEANNYIITWAVGHLVELFEPEDYDPGLKRWRLETLPVIPDKFRYKPIKRNIKQLNVIKKLFSSKQFSQVIIATDAGREGEVIARTILLEAGFTDKKRIKRFWTSQALVPEVVLDTMKKLKPVTDYDRLWRAGYYRQVADWLVGMNCTRVLTVRLKDLYSVGRVQTAVLALLVDRRKERDDFVPQTYWIIKVEFENEKGRWIGNWYRKKESRLLKKEEVENLIEKLSSTRDSGAKDSGAKNSGHVISVNKQKKKEAAPLLFSLTDLQQEANNKFGFSAKKTLTIAQSLYQNKKCLSYPRTDSRVLGTKNLGLVKDVINKLKTSYGNIFQNIDEKKVSLSNKRVFNDAGLTDHHALMPFKTLSANSSYDEKQIFDLVLKRFAATFYPDCEFEQTNLVTELSGETFKTFGKVIIVAGWRQIYDDKKKAEIKTIPALVKGDSAKPGKITPEEKQTTPPPDYNDALILKDMTNPGKFVNEDRIKQFFRGEMGIGTQSTRAQIIETLIARKYADRKGKTIIVTQKGIFLIETLRKTVSARVLTSPEETARWEMTLNKIALGEKVSLIDGKESGENKNLQFLNNIKEFVSRSVNELKTAQLANMPETTFSLFKNDSKQNNTRLSLNDNNSKQKNTRLSLNDNNSKQKNTGLSLNDNNPKQKNTGLSLNEPAFIKCNCPVCGARVIEGKKGYGCSNWKYENGGCCFVIWKEIYGKKLTKENVASLILGKKTRLYVFKRNNGNKFKGKIKMSEDKPGQFKIVIIPENSDNPDELITMSCRT